MQPQSDQSWNRGLQARHGLPCLLAGLGCLLASPAVGSRLALDDYVLALRGDGGGLGLAAQPGNLFAFAGAEDGQNARLLESGTLLPWWTDPELKLTFFRPFASVLHQLDAWLWPARPEWMYLHSLLWLAALLVVGARVYRQLGGGQGWVPIAAALFAFNDANGAAASWLSNRNVIVGSCWALCALSFQVRARQRQKPWSVAAAVFVALSLLSGEIGLSAVAYLFAYAVTLEPGSLVTRLKTLIPTAVPVVAWVVAYRLVGAGAENSGVYLHPLHDALDFGRAFPERFLALAGSAWGPIPADLTFLGGGALARGLDALNAVLLVTGLTLGWRGLRDSPVNRFLVLGALLALLPLTASFPGDRTLIPANWGAMGVTARALQALLERRRTLRAPERVLLFGMLAQALAAPLLLPARARQMQALADAVETATAGVVSSTELENKEVILLGGPSDFLVSYLQAERSWKRAPHPRAVRWLGTGAGQTELQIDDGTHLTLERREGFFGSAPERLYRRAMGELARPVELTGASFRAASFDAAGAPHKVAAMLAEPLPNGAASTTGNGGSRYLAFVWHVDRYERLVVGATHRETLYATPLLELLTSSSWNHWKALWR
jgi:hypothetical protein